MERLLLFERDVFIKKKLIKLKTIKKLGFKN